MTIGEVLDLYGAGHARGVKSPQTIGYSIKALRPYFGLARVSSLNRATCEAYVRHRGRSNATVAPRACPPECGDQLVQARGRAGRRRATDAAAVATGPR